MPEPILSNTNTPALTLLKLALCLLFALPIQANEITLKDVVAFERKVESLMVDKSLSLESRFDKMHGITNEMTHQLVDRLALDKPLNGYQLSMLKHSISACLILTERLRKKLATFTPVSVTFEGSDEELIWLTSSINLLQRYKQSYDLLYKSTPLRRAIKNQIVDQDSPISDFNAISKRILNKTQVKALARVTRRVIENDQLARHTILQTRLKSTDFYQTVYSKKSTAKFYRQNTLRTSLGDGISNLGRHFTGTLSAGFGALAGPVEWREGRLHKNLQAQQALVSRLQPLDLLLEKKNFKLTDYAIPGYWGHIAVWLGTEAQLKQIGMWDQPAIKPYQEMIRQGYSIYEVRRGGLNWDKLDNWLNLDAVAVVRHKKVNHYQPLEYSKVYQQLFAQSGKKFDYNFDAMTEDVTTCTEIVSRSYGPINWPTSKVIGRYTLQPDHIASLVLYDDSPLELITYIEGTEADHAFKSLSDFSALMGFREKQDAAPGFEKRFTKCEIDEFGSHRTERSRFNKTCTNYYESLVYSPPTIIPVARQIIGTGEF